MLTSGMDCRIGTPNKHLSSADNELKNPLYATGIGLVISFSPQVVARFEYTVNSPFATANLSIHFLSVF